jgi:uncharacterized flavoprotein (TIGR03862 family)
MAEPVAIIGAGPAGLMAAEVVSAAGVAVDVYDTMPSVGRKLLRAGIGGLNLTHSEPDADFVRHYGSRQDIIACWLGEFGPDALRAWARGLGIDTFVGSSGRVFPVGMKAAPLLRAWLQRLRQQGVRFHLRHRWLGWDNSGLLRFETPDGERKTGAGGTALALGGGSWKRLGSDGTWVKLLAGCNIAIAPLRPANCGFEVGWSEHLRQHCAGQPVKAVAARFGDTTRNGEFVVTRHGIEGSLIYALSAPLRDAIERDGKATLEVDLAPGRTQARLSADLSLPQGRDSLANHLRRRAGIDGVKAKLLREVATAEHLHDSVQLAALIKALPLKLIAARPLDEAISSAGGVRFSELNGDLMLKALPGVFCAGEMLDWEAPTGGYLLSACFASGYHAGHGLVRWHQENAKEKI